MQNKKCFKYLKVALLVSSIFVISACSKWKMPVYALGPFLKLNVTPANIAFNVVDAAEPAEYYSGSQKVTVMTHHTLPLLSLPWHLGIRAGEAYLRDAINPENRIPVSQLRWSRNDQPYQQLSQKWALVNSYFNFNGDPQKESISYRLYPEPGQSLPAGVYSLRIEFDARWLNFPWN